MTTLHARIKGDGSHAIVENSAGVPQINREGANLIEDDGSTAWFSWEDFELVTVPDNEEHNVYWDTELDEDDDRPYGDDTARIIDQALGGVIAYCHRVNASRIVKAIRAAEET